MSTYAVLGLVWGTIFWVFLGKMVPRLGYLTMHRVIGNDLPCVTPECDFSVFWPAGFLARAHDFVLLYQPERFAVWGASLFFPGAHIETFYYPPPMLLPSMLISYLPFEIAFFVWTLVWIAIYVVLLRWVRLSWAVIVLGLLSPAALWNAELGQMGVMGGAVLVAGLLASGEHPWRAGGLLGLLVCKPQIGLLVPATLWGQRNWRAIGAFGLICGGLSLLTLALFGWPVWSLYLSAGRVHSAQILDAVFGAVDGVSVFWMLRSWHAGLVAAYAVQAVSAAMAMTLCFWVWRTENLPRIERMALTVFLSLLATPYGFSDDMVAYAIALAVLAERRRWRIEMADVLFWLWPALCPIISRETGVLFTPLIVILVVARTWIWVGMPMPHLPMRTAVLPRAG